MARTVRRPRRNSGDQSPSTPRPRIGPRYEAIPVMDQYTKPTGVWWLYDWHHRRSVGVLGYQLDAEMTAQELNKTTVPRLVRMPF